MSIIETDATVTGTGRTAYQERLKTHFLSKWDDWVHKKVKIAEEVAQKKGEMGGKESLGSVRTELPQSAGIALLEGMSLPTASSSDFIQPTVHARDLFSLIRVTGHAVRASRGGDKYAWAQVQKEEMDGATSQFQINFARMLYLGRYQILGTVSSFNDSTDTISLFGRDARTSAAADFWKFGAHYLRKNMELDYLASSIVGDPVIRADDKTQPGMKITAIDKSSATTPTVTVDVDPNADYAVTDPASGSFLIPFNSRQYSIADPTMSSYWSGISGVLEYASDLNLYASVYDLDRTAGDKLSGVHNKNGGTLRPFDENLFHLVVDNVVDNGAGDEPNKVMWNSATKREYVKAVQGDRRFLPSIEKMGYGPNLAIQSGDTLLPCTADTHCPPGLAFVLNTKDWGWLSQSEMGPIDKTGERFVSGQDAHEYIIHKSGNDVCMRPFNNGIVDDIDFDTDELTS